MPTDNDVIPYTEENPPAPRCAISPALDTLIMGAIDDAVKGKPGTAMLTLRKGILASLEIAYAAGEVAALKAFREHMQAQSKVRP